MGLLVYAVCFDCFVVVTGHCNSVVYFYLWLLVCCLNWLFAIVICCLIMFAFAICVCFAVASGMFYLFWIVVFGCLCFVWEVLDGTFVVGLRWLWWFLLGTCLFVVLLDWLLFCCFVFGLWFVCCDVFVGCLFDLVLVWEFGLKVCLLGGLIGLDLLVLILNACFNSVVCISFLVVYVAFCLRLISFLMFVCVGCYFCLLAVFVVFTLFVLLLFLCLLIVLFCCCLLISLNFRFVRIAYYVTRLFICFRVWLGVCYCGLIGCCLWFLFAWCYYVVYGVLLCKFLLKWCLLMFALLFVFAWLLRYCLLFVLILVQLVFIWRLLGWVCALWLVFLMLLIWCGLLLGLLCISCGFVFVCYMVFLFMCLLV